MPYVAPVQEAGRSLGTYAFSLLRNTDAPGLPETDRWSTVTDQPLSANGQLLAVSGQISLVGRRFGPVFRPQNRRVRGKTE